MCKVGLASENSIDLILIYKSIYHIIILLPKYHIIISRDAKENLLRNLKIYWWLERYQSKLRRNLLYHDREYLPNIYLLVILRSKPINIRCKYLLLFFPCYYSLLMFFPYHYYSICTEGLSQCSKTK